MPRPKTRTDYVELLERYAAEGYKPAAISRLLEEDIKGSGEKDWPSERQVRRLYAAWQAKPERYRLESGYFHWPESMLSPKLMPQGALPWEASRAALDLVRIREESDRPRPTFREARWFWRLRLASPSIPDDQADRRASELAAHEFAGLAGAEPVSKQAVEWMLAYEPWSDENRRQAYERVAERRGLGGTGVTALPKDPEARRQFFTGQYGDELGSEIAAAVERRHADFQDFAKLPPEEQRKRSIPLPEQEQEDSDNG